MISTHLQTRSQTRFRSFIEVWLNDLIARRIYPPGASCLHSDLTALIRALPLDVFTGGVIFSSNRWNSILTDAVALIEASAPVNSWQAAQRAAWVEWNTHFLAWLTTSPNGIGASRTKNNRACHSLR